MAFFLHARSGRKIHDPFAPVPIFDSNELGPVAFLPACANMHGFACFSTGVVQGLENARICNCIRISNPSNTNHPTTKAEGSRLRQALQEGAAL